MISIVLQILVTVMSSGADWPENSVLNLTTIAAAEQHILICAAPRRAPGPDHGSDPHDEVNSDPYGRTTSNGGDPYGYSASNGRDPYGYSTTNDPDPYGRKYPSDPYGGTAPY